MDSRAWLRIIVLGDQILVTYSNWERTIRKYKFYNANSFVNWEQQRFRKPNLRL